MTIVTGTADFQALFQGLLSEIANVDGQPYGLPIVKLSGDSTVWVGLLNQFVPDGYDNVSMLYSGTNLSQAIFRSGGISGTILTTINLTYDASDNLILVQRT